MAVAFANPQVTVNNVVQLIKPNTLAFTEGFGEQIVRAASAGGAKAEQIFADNVEDNFSDVKFSLDPTVDNITSAREWKTIPGLIVITVTGTVVDGSTTTTFSRTFNRASLVNNVEVPLGSDTQIDLEFKSDPAQ